MVKVDVPVLSVLPVETPNELGFSVMSFSSVGLAKEYPGVPIWIQFPPHVPVPAIDCVSGANDWLKNKVSVQSDPLIVKVAPLNTKVELLVEVLLTTPFMVTFPSTSILPKLKLKVAPGSTVNEPPIKGDTSALIVPGRM